MSPRRPPVEVADLKIESRDWIRALSSVDWALPLLAAILFAVVVGISRWLG